MKPFLIAVSLAAVLLIAALAIALLPTHTRAIAAYSGLAKTIPLFSIIMLIVTFSSIALPGSASSAISAVSATISPAILPVCATSLRERWIEASCSWIPRFSLCASQVDCLTPARIGSSRSRPIGPPPTGRSLHPAHDDSAATVSNRQCSLTRGRL